MDHVVRPPSESSFPAADARLKFPRCIDLLESAVRDALIHFSDAERRWRAQQIAREMSAGCRTCGLKKSSAVLRSMEALLALTNEDARGIRSSIAERLLDLLGLLKGAHLESISSV